MKVKRTEKIKVDLFRVGDIISFKLNNGEKMQMTAVKDEPDGMIFCSVDCLEEESCMNESGSNSGGWNESDLRAKLNGEILDRFPKKIKKLLTPFANGDLLRIPTEKEIFGKNKCGENETGVEQRKSMKQRRNRIAFRGLDGEWEWYWLQNRAQNSETLFADAYSAGGADCSFARSTGGVRPVVKIKNPVSAPACQVRDNEDEQES